MKISRRRLNAIEVGCTTLRFWLLALVLLDAVQHSCIKQNRSPPFKSVCFMSFHIQESCEHHHAIQNALEQQNDRFWTENHQILVRSGDFIKIQEFVQVIYIVKIVSSVQKLFLSITKHFLKEVLFVRSRKLQYSERRQNCNALQSRNAVLAADHCSVSRKNVQFLIGSFKMFFFP